MNTLRRVVVVNPTPRRLQAPDKQRKYVFKRAQRGLFHGKTRITGNSISFSHKKTRRAWLPNIQRKKFWSPLLGEEIRVHVTTKALRCIDKAGGIDNYILYTKEKWLASEYALALRQRMLAQFEEVAGRRFQRSQKEANELLLRDRKESATTKDVER